MRPTSAGNTATRRWGSRSRRDPPLVPEGKPLIVEGKALIVEGKPLIVEGKPLIVEGKPLIVEGKPLVVEGKPLIIEGKPGVVEGKPLIVEGKPGVVEGKPLIVEGKPGVPDGKLGPRATDPGASLARISRRVVGGARIPREEREAWSHGCCAKAGNWRPNRGGGREWVAERGGPSCGILTFGREGAAA